LQDLGLDNVRFCPQGIDPSLFHPAPPTGFLADRFVIFSGGKLEYRKGQDIVVAAFRAFRQRHPEALLLTAWHNLWPQSVATLARSPHVSGPPEITEGNLQTTRWLCDNGLPPDSFIDLGALSNAATAPLLREADIALFPNRCEGGTNLVAMECMACGVPCILSRNTGHLDLTVEGACYALDRQLDIGTLAGLPSKRGWGESGIEEIVECLEAAWRDRDEARRRGAAAAAMMAGWSWSRQIDRLLAAISEVA
ncbi:MAG: glycosyltransferase, partial [Rhodospirillales bacterium]|nr:glycosyltransferase [Rhodospirillales bacterium]